MSYMCNICVCVCVSSVAAASHQAKAEVAKVMDGFLRMQAPPCEHAASA